MSHPGESINFDGPDLQEDQEEELAFDDQHREQELRDLLSKALPDDLLEDDIQSIPSSRESSSFSSCSPDLSPRQPSPTVDDQHHWLYKPDAYHQVSTPHVWGEAPPLKTPAGVVGIQGIQHNDTLTNGHAQAIHQPAHRLSQGSDNHTPDSSQDWHFEHHHNQLHLPEPHNNKYSQGLSPTTAAWDAARQNAYQHHSDLDLSEHEEQSQHYGAKQNDHMMGVYEHEDAQTLHHADHDFVGNGHGDEREDAYFYLPDNHGSDDEARFDEERRYSQQYETPKSTKLKTLVNGNAPGWDGQNRFPPQSEKGPVIRHASSEPNVGLVQYQRRKENDRDEARTDARRVVSEQRMVNGEDQLSRDPYQTGFSEAGSRGQDIAQLEILYQARGREINKLTSQLETLREEHAREKRILNHQLAMAQGERDGIGTTYGETQQLLNQMNSENHKLRGQLQAVQLQIQTLKDANQQQHSDLDTANATIESLNQQLIEVQRSKPLNRAREQQESLLVGLQQKFSQENAELREKVDLASKQVAEKTAMVEQLEARLSAAVKANNQARLEHAETVNRLTASLQESQKRCQELILQGSSPAVQDLQIKLNDAGTSKAMAENMCQTLQEELAELKDQIMLYEGAVDLGVISVSGVNQRSPTTPTDAEVVRNLAKEDWKTPQPSCSQKSLKEPLSPEETLIKLKAELSRSLQSIRSKREHVTRLQVELREAKIEGQTWKGRMEGAEARVGQLETQLKELKNTLSETTFRGMDAHKDDLERLKSDLEAKTVACKEEEEKVAVLKAQMAQMVAESDEDKKEAVDRCQKTCLQLHEDASRNMREQLVSELQNEKETMVEAHQYQLQKVRDEMSLLENELDKTKALYVELCEEKKCLEENTERQMKIVLDESLQKMKADFEKEKTIAIGELKSSMETSHRAEIVLLMENKKKENEEELEKIHSEMKQLQEKYDEEIATLKSVHEEQTKELENQITEAEEKIKIAQEYSKKDESNELNSMATELNNLQQRYEDLSASYTSQVNSEVEKAKEQWMRQENQRRMSLDRIAASSIEQMKADHAVQLAEWQAKFTDDELQVKERVAAAVKEAKESWRKDEEKRKRLSFEKKMDENKERESKAQKELQTLKQQLKQSLEALGVSQRDGQQVRANYAQLKGRHEQEVTGLKQELRSTQTKLQQAEKTLHQELEQLQTEMREANSVTMESMQERVSAIQQKHSLLVEKMKSEWEEERQQLKREKMKKQETFISVGIQTIGTDDLKEELRTHYMKAVENVKASAMSYVTDMQKRCQETLRSAVIEERKRVAAKMHKFYTNKINSMRDSPRENKGMEELSTMRQPQDQTQYFPAGKPQVLSSSSPIDSSSDNVIGRRLEVTQSQAVTSRVTRRVHSNECQKPTAHRSINGHPLADIKKAQQQETSKEPLREPAATSHHPAEVHDMRKVQLQKSQRPLSELQNFQGPVDDHQDLESKDEGNCLREQVGQEIMMRRRGLVVQNGVALMEDENAAQGFQQFTLDDIGENSALLLKNKRDYLERTAPASVTVRNSRSPPMKTQLLQHGNITARRRSDGKDHNQRQDKPLKVASEQSQMVHASQSTNNVTSRTKNISTYTSVKQDMIHSRKSYVNNHSEHTQGIKLKTDTNLSFGSEYSELPPSIHESRVPSALQRHPFLEQDLTHTVPLPKRLVELQHGLSHSQPVRDTHGHHLYHVSNKGQQVQELAGPKVILKAKQISD